MSMKKSLALTMSAIMMGAPILASIPNPAVIMAENTNYVSIEKKGTYKFSSYGYANQSYPNWSTNKNVVTYHGNPITVYSMSATQATGTTRNYLMERVENPICLKMLYYASTYWGENTETYSDVQKHIIKEMAISKALGQEWESRCNDKLISEVNSYYTFCNHQTEVPTKYVSLVRFKVGHNSYIGNILTSQVKDVPIASKIDSPNGLSATYYVRDNNLSSLDVKWDAISGAKGYIVRVDADNDKQSPILKEVSSDTQVKMYGTEEANKVSVAAIGSDGLIGKWSDEVQNEVVEDKPSAPTNVKGKYYFSEEQGNTLTVSWDKVEGASKYLVEYTPKGATTSITKETTETSLCFSDIDKDTVSKETTVKVAAISSSGTQSEWTICSAYSVLSDPVTIDPAPSAPANISSYYYASKRNGNTLSISWDKVDGATKYLVEITPKNDGSPIIKESTETKIVLNDTKGNLAGAKIRVSTVAANGKTSEYAECTKGSAGCDPQFGILPAENLKATIKAKQGATSGTLHVSWDKVELAEKYVVTITSKDGETITKETGNLSLDVENVSVGSKVSVKAFDYYLDESAPVSVEATIDNGLPTVKNLESRFFVQANGYSYMTFKWDKVEGASKYLVETSLNGKTELKEVTEPKLALTGNSEIIKTNAKVATVDAEGNVGPFVECKAGSGTCEPVTPKILDAPTNLFANVSTKSGKDTGTLHISWDKVSGALKYIVKISPKDGTEFTMETTDTRLDIPNSVLSNTVSVVAVDSKGNLGIWSDSIKNGITIPPIIEKPPVIEIANPPVSTPQTGDTTKVSGSTYTVKNDGSVKLSKANKSAKKVTIPASVTVDGQSLPVTEVANSAFSGDKKLKSVTIGKNVKKIGKKAFYKAKNLKTVKIKSKKIKSIGKKSFSKTKATVKVPKSKKKAYKKMLKKAGFKGTVK